MFLNIIGEINKQESDKDEADNKTGIAVYQEQVYDNKALSVSLEKEEEEKKKEVLIAAKSEEAECMLEAVFDEIEYEI